MIRKKDSKALVEFKGQCGHQVKESWLPRVTSVLQIVAKPGLLRYYAQQKNYTTAQTALRCAAENGIRVHSIAEDFFEGKICKDKYYKTVIDKLSEWKKKYKPKIIATEKRVVDDKEHFYCGTADIIAKIDDEIGVIDIKTGSGIWEEYGLQTAAYMHAYNLKAKERATTSWILRLDTYQVCKICGAKRRNKNGDVRVTGGKYFCEHEWNGIETESQFKKITNTEDNFKAFLHAKGLWEWANKRLLKQIENYPKHD